MPTRIEATLLVVGGFRDTSGFEWRAGDRAPLSHGAVRQAALANPDLFAIEYETAPVDVDWVRQVDQEHERRYQAEVRRRDQVKTDTQRALQAELAEQDGSAQKELERRYQRQERERTELEEERRKELERRQIEEQLALGRRPLRGFNV